MISRFLLNEQLSKISISLLMSLIVVRPERYANLLITIIITYSYHHHLGLFNCWSDRRNDKEKI